MQKITWSIKNIYMGVGIVVALLAVMAIGSTILSLHYSELADEAATRRHQSYLLADEFRQSSDDLTRLARTYVISGDPKWEKQYFEILDIRNGKKARPEGNDKIYWDFRAANMVGIHSDGEAIALLDLMKQMGFSEMELSKLAEVQANSNDLVETETIAMNMVKGLYADEGGEFTRKSEPDMKMAREMMHDLTYHQNKAKIMGTIDEFFAMLDKRTAHELAVVKAANERWAIIATLVTGVMAALVLFTLFFVQRRTSAVLSEVNDAVKHIAEGDLSNTINTSDNSEEGRLLAMMSDMQEKLAEIMGSIRGGANNVASASIEITRNNFELSHRNEVQASALEETAASMDQFNSSVNQNAENVKHASQLATKANQIAIEGGVAVGQVVSTMNEISASSQKITDIIGVIDSIAYQTNILALNASVEAARAGEQGRSFAVVASEVRNLAQHSSEAAKEIKALIVNSVERVEQGSTQVDQTRATMDEIVKSIHRVSDIMSEIDRETVEQQASISQVNHAIIQIDQSTQFNASLVEHTAIAAENLKEQAGQLVESMSHFKLGHEELEQPDNSQCTTVPALLISKPKLYVVK